MTMLNVVSVRAAARTQILLMVIKVSALIVIIIGGVVYVTGGTVSSLSKVVLY